MSSWNSVELSLFLHLCLASLPWDCRRGKQATLITTETVVNPLSSATSCYISSAHLIYHTIYRAIFKIIQICLYQSIKEYNKTPMIYNSMDYIQIVGASPLCLTASSRSPNGKIKAPPWPMTSLDKGQKCLHHCHIITLSWGIARTWTRNYIILNCRLIEFYEFQTSFSCRVGYWTVSYYMCTTSIKMCL